MNIELLRDLQFTLHRECPINAPCSDRTCLRAGLLFMETFALFTHRPRWRGQEPIFECAKCAAIAPAEIHGEFRKIMDNDGT